MTKRILAALAIALLTASMLVSTALAGGKVFVAPTAGGKVFSAPVAVHSDGGKVFGGKVF